MSNNLYDNSTFVDAETLTHTKLNTLDSNIDNALTMVSGVLAAFGGDDRVVDDSGVTTEIEVTETAPASLNVDVNVGYAVVSEAIVRNETASVLTIVAPVVSNRWDLVQISNEGVLSTKSSAEQAVPVEPNADANNIKLAAIYLPQNAPHINDEGGAAGGDGEIFDRRTFSLHPTTMSRHVTFTIPGDMSTTGGPASDGFYVGSSATTSGFTFGVDVTVSKGFIQCQDIPTGADLIFTIHNFIDPGSDTITLTDGLSVIEDSTISLAFDSTDDLGIQCTQTGSTTAGSWVNIVLQYEMT